MQLFAKTQSLYLEHCKKTNIFLLFSEPEYLANPNLDELSGMTYLSYFMKEEDSPGYYATLNWVKNQIPHQRINNFRVST